MITDQQRELVRAEIREKIASDIGKAMHENAITRDGLARFSGVDARTINGVLSGNHNVTVRELADIYFALGRDFRFLSISEEYGHGG